MNVDEIMSPPDIKPPYVIEGDEDDEDERLVYLYPRNGTRGITNPIGGGLLVYRGYRYHYQRTGMAGQKYFMCATSGKTSCKARLVVSAAGRVEPDKLGSRVRGTHCDEPNPHKIGAALIKSELIQKARAGMNTRQVLAECEQQAHALATGVAANLPHKSTLQRMVQRIRREQLNLPASSGGLRVPEAKSLNEISIPEEILRLKGSQENVLLHDAGLVNDGNEDSPRFFMFGSELTLDFLVHSTTWLIDSTRLPCGMPVGQVWTIHACFEKSGGSELCVVFVFPGAGEEHEFTLYTQALTKLKDVAPEISPKLIFSDLNDLERKAIEDVLGDEVEVQSTWIHLLRRLDNCVGQMGAADNAHASELNGIARALSMVSLVPEEDVERALLAMEAKVAPSKLKVLRQKLSQLIEFFRQEFMSSVEWWNCWHVFSDDSALSPAHFFAVVEMDGFHRQFETRLEDKHRNLLNTSSSGSIEEEGVESTNERTGGGGSGGIGFVNDVVPLIVRELESAEVRGERKANLTRSHIIETKERRIYTRMRQYKQQQNSATNETICEYLFEMVELMDTLKH